MGNNIGWSFHHTRHLEDRNLGYAKDLSVFVCYHLSLERPQDCLFQNDIAVCCLIER